MKEPDQTREVADLFDRKAHAWGKKYGARGALQARRELFRSALTARVLPGAHILELGCGAGDLAAELSELGYRVSAFDVSTQMIERARSRFSHLAIRWEKLPLSWTQLPVAAGDIDAVVASSVFEYLDQPGQVLTEIARVLRPHGWLLATVPDLSHPARWAERFLRRALGSSGSGRRARAVPHTPLSGYAQYLRVSKNRFSQNEWRRRMGGVGLLTDEPAHTLGALQLLMARRGTV